MACGMLSSIGDFLKMGSDEIIRNMYDISDDIDEEDSSSRYLPSIFLLLIFNLTFFFDRVFVCDSANVDNFVTQLGHKRVFSKDYIDEKNELSLRGI